MSRFSISALSETKVNRFVPFNRALTVHIFCGTATVAIVFLATLSFLCFYGTLCIDGEQEYCEKLNSEITWTGYAIACFVLLLGVTSSYRHKIPYEVFYTVHHLAFVLYGITVAHTFDIQQRKQSKQRSQTFSWVSASLLFYLCDQAAMYLSYRYHARLVSSSAIKGCSDSNMVIFKMRRPVLFNFKPGQYALHSHG
jgi:predicted ferric reductase